MSDDILLDKRKTFWRLVLIFIGITYIGLSFYLFLRYNITAPFSIDDEKIFAEIFCHRSAIRANAARKCHRSRNRRV